MSTNQSQYSIDLSALDPDSVTSSSTPQNHHRINKRGPLVIASQAGIDRDMEDRLEFPKPAESTASSPTRYSIHLSALEPDTATSTPVAQRHVTQIKSDDIEGPSDFTQNIAFWLNRPAKSKSETSNSADLDPEINSKNEPRASSQPSATHYDASKDYIRPSVQDYNSPLPPPLQRRTSTINSSSCSPSREIRNGESQPRVDHLLEQLALLESRCQQLQNTNKELESSLQEQRVARQMEESKRETAAISMLGGNEAQLSQEVQRLEARLQASNSEIRQLNERLRTSTRLDSITMHKDEKGRKQMDDIDEVPRELIQSLKHELSEERRARNADKSTNKPREDCLAQDLSTQVQRSERQQGRLEALEDRLAAEVEQNEKLKAESQTNQQKLALQGLKWKQRALEYQQQIKQAQNPIEVAREKNNDETQHLAPEDNANAAQQWKTQSELLQTQVNDLKRHLSTQSEQHEQQIQSLREEYDGVAKEVDDWIVSQVKAKEDGYTASKGRSERKISQQEARIQELERLYAQCGKELLLAWGREDFGPAPAGEKQKYRYKYV